MRIRFLSLLCLLAFAYPGGAESLPPVKAVLFPFREAVISARVDSTLESCGFQPGEAFESGAVLARLDDRRFALDEKRSVEQSEYAKAVYDDQKKLHDQNFASDFELKKREFEFRVAESSLAEARLNLSYCTIEAPFAGRVEELLTREFETVRAGQPLFRIIDDNRLLAVMNIPVSRLPEYPLGADITILLPENKLVASGKVHEIMPRADHRSGTIQIKALVENPKRLFTAGMTGELADARK